MLTMSGICPRRSLPRERGPACAAAMTQAGDELATQLAARLCVDGGVDGLVRQVATGLIWTDPRGRARNLPGRPT